MTRPRARRTAVTVLVATLLAALTACGGGNDASGSGGEGAPRTELTVLAASSLTDVFEAAAAVYEKEHPDIKLRFSFAGSQELAAQVRQGAPADALVTADTTTLKSVREDTGTPVVVARNRLVIVTEKGNPQGITSLEDLADADTKVVLAAPEVPVGRYSKQVLDRQKVDVDAVSREANVRAVLGKVALGEADAGIVYATDAATAPEKVDAVEIPDRANAVAAYPAATLRSARHAEAAAEFVAWLKSPQAQKILRGAGFEKP